MSIDYIPISVLSEKASEHVNPPHYKHGNIECIDAIAAQLSREELTGYLRGNITKYLWRYKHKNGVEDLEKANWYFSKLLEMERGK
jgi:hypothetical protein